MVGLLPLVSKSPACQRGSAAAKGMCLMLGPNLCPSPRTMRGVCLASPWALFLNAEPCLLVSPQTQTTGPEPLGVCLLPGPWTMTPVPQGHVLALDGGCCLGSGAAASAGERLEAMDCLNLEFVSLDCGNEQMRHEKR